MVTPIGDETGGARSVARALDGGDEDAVRAEEQALDRARLAQVLRAGSWVWAAVAPVYVPIAAWVEPQPIAPFLAVHAIAWLAMLAAGRGLARGAPMPRVLALALLVPALATGVTSALYRGVVSPLAGAELVTMTAFAIALPMPVRRSWPWHLALVAAWPATLLAIAWGAPAVVGSAPGLAALRAQLDDPRLAADFRESVLALVVGAALAATGQHAQWRLRRTVLEARARERYRLEDRIGAGGMGEVYRAFHAGLGRAVALKILRERADPTLAERFVREVRATAVLRHPSTVRVLDCGTTADGRLYYTMELLEGATLHDLVRREGPLAPERACHLVLAAARALAEAHERGLVHRDVKPENLFVTVQGLEGDVVKVLDFGIARSLAGESALTQEGTLVGTPRYMALEQALGESVDARADVYALGATLYFALTGTAPIDEPTIFAVVAAHAAGTILPPRVRVPSIPAELDAIVMRCLAGDRAARPADAGWLARAIEETGLAQRHRPVSAIAGGPARSGEPIATGVRRTAAVTSEDPTREAARG